MGCSADLTLQMNGTTLQMNGTLQQAALALQDFRDASADTMGLSSACTRHSCRVMSGRITVPVGC